MKVRIFSKGQGWYISATNYKDNQDKCYINVHFVQHTEPEYIDNGRGFSTLEIDIQEAKFSSYHGKAGLTIFKYEILNVEPVKGYTIEHGPTGAKINGIEDEDLPFM
ncbi:MAG: hypothetical protein IKD59_05470 [Lachnospiraceae bacterium]|nr:hypothetical protein [Lachnospiraceae bacterium]